MTSEVFQRMKVHWSVEDPCHPTLLVFEKRRAREPESSRDCARSRFGGEGFPTCRLAWKALRVTRSGTRYVLVWGTPAHISGKLSDPMGPICLNLTIRFKFFPNVNCFTPLDRSVIYFIRLGGQPSKWELSA
jgi:hypothetical protein